MTDQEREALTIEISKAVQKKQLIRFYYVDEYSNFKGYRTVEPYLIGIHKQSKNTNLRAWFLPDSTQILIEKPDWKMYVIDWISKLELLNETYSHTRAGYNPNDKMMKTIICSTLVTR